MRGIPPAAGHPGLIQRAPEERLRAMGGLPEAGIAGMCGVFGVAKAPPG